MPTRVLISGHVHWASSDFRKAPNPARSIPRDRKGDPINCAFGIAGDDFRTGTPVRDAAEGVVYRVVEKLPLEGGWAVSLFWQKRWGIDHRGVLSLVERGLLDAAMEAGSKIRRYRCRDERLVLDSSVLPKQRRRLAVLKHNSKRFRRSDGF